MPADRVAAVGTVLEGSGGEGVAQRVGCGRGRLGLTGRPMARSAVWNAVSTSVGKSGFRRRDTKR